MEKATDFRIVYVTISSIESAAHISKIVISEHLAACCTLIPNAISYFSWEDSISERLECVIMIKTKKDLIQKLCNRINELHNDEVPEIITVTIQESSKPYSKWMDSTLNID